MTHSKIPSILTNLDLRLANTMLNQPNYLNKFAILLTTLLVSTSSFIPSTNAQQNPSIVHITPGQTVDLSDTVDLSCSVQYAAEYPIIWTKLSDNPNNPPLFISRDAALTVLDNRYSIRHDDSSSTYTLQVSKVSCFKYISSKHSRYSLSN